MEILLFVKFYYLELYVIFLNIIMFWLYIVFKIFLKLFICVGVI